VISPPPQVVVHSAHNKLQVDRSSFTCCRTLPFSVPLLGLLLHGAIGPVSMTSTFLFSCLFSQIGPRLASWIRFLISRRGPLSSALKDRPRRSFFFGPTRGMSWSANAFSFPVSTPVSFCQDPIILGPQFGFLLKETPLLFLSSSSNNGCRLWSVSWKGTEILS